MYLVVQVSDVHHEVNIVSEVILHYTSQDILGHIVPVKATYVCIEDLKFYTQISSRT